MTTTITQSSLKTFRTCRRRYQLRYLDELAPVDVPEYLSFGTLVHRCLEAFHGANDLELYDIFAAVADPELRVRLTVMIQEYIAAHYATGDESRYRVLATELTLRDLPIMNPRTGRTTPLYTLSCKLDAIVQDCSTSEFLLWENKTAGSVDHKYWDRLGLDTQIAIYIHAARQAGYPVTGVIYNVLQTDKLTRPSLRKKPMDLLEWEDTLRSWYTPDRYQRLHLTVDEHRIAMARVELWEATRQLRQAAQSGVYEINAESCVSWRGTCPYFDLCKSGGDEFIRDNLYTRRAAHSELTEEI